VIGPPDFVGVGAQRCGTTWWFRTLLGHPQIRAPAGRHKELHFFNRFSITPMRDADVEGYYERLWRKRGQVAGEWTPRYMSDPWTPPLLKRVAPDAKLLVLLRDPIERYRSGVAHRLRDETDSPPEVVATDAIERGFYARHLRRLYEHFAPERVLVLQYERCVADGRAQYRRTLEFLGVDAGHEPEGLDEPRGRSTQGGRPLSTELGRQLREWLEPDVEELSRLVPELDVALWPSFSGG
jgi:hypothetical protein